MPTPDLTTRTDAALDQWIENYEKADGGTAKPLYRQLLEERARRADEREELKLENSLAHLKDAAIRQVCTTYSALAMASNVPWSTARLKMNGPRGHLSQLLDLCHARSLPLLTALCVNHDNVEVGELGEDALAGFIGGARRLRHSIISEKAFHHQCRDECWAWGKTQAGAVP